jgi:hypothetical protein
MGQRHQRQSRYGKFIRGWKCVVGFEILHRSNVESFSEVPALADVPNDGDWIVPLKSTWWREPAGAWVLAALTVLILAAARWLMDDEIRSCALGDDDFTYIAHSRDWPTTRENLLTPNATHIVPIFRLWTWVLVKASGDLKGMPWVFGVASYLALAVTAGAVGLLVKLETGQTALGLAAVTVLGVSSVILPTAAFYAAGQALWAGTWIVLTILMARAWSLKGGGWRLGLTALTALTAPAVWSGGLLAGPAALAYVWVKKSSGGRGALLVLAGTSALAILIILVLTRGMIKQTPLIWEQHDELWPRPIQGALHVAQAIVETLVFGNLGLDVVTTPFQAVILVLGLAGLWSWSRGGPGRINPLEAAGATIFVGSYLLVYFFRGNLPFSSLRPVTWYNAIPQVGAVLFAAGWWAGLRPANPGPITRRCALAVSALVVTTALIQAPRADRYLIANAPAMMPGEARTLLEPELQRIRALYFNIEGRDLQSRALARLDKVRSLALRQNIGRRALHDVFGRLKIPGLNANPGVPDAFDLLSLPPDNRSAPVDALRLHATFDYLLQPEPRERPPWLPKSDPWPP